LIVQAEPAEAITPGPETFALLPQLVLLGQSTAQQALVQMIWAQALLTQP